MSKSVIHSRFSAYQNQVLKLNQIIDGKEFLPSHLKNLQEYYGDTGVPYYFLIHNGVRFTSYVGVFQIGNTIIEVLPFLKGSIQSKDFWRSTLSYMLSKSGLFEFKNQFSSSQSRKNKSVLHQYFEIFLNELDILVHRGLIKNYNKKEENLNILKGKLVFSKQVRKNFIHREKMYVRHTSYTQETTLNKILYTTLLLIDKNTLDPSLKVRIKHTLSFFPKMPVLKASEKLFQKIKYNRNSEIYKKAISISKLLLLQKNPGFLPGSNEIFSLMVDMNLLWKIYIYKTLKNKYKVNSLQVKLPIEKDLFEMQKRKSSKIDYVLHINKESKKKYLILDAKWDLDEKMFSNRYLKELYLCASIYECSNILLVLPGTIETIEIVKSIKADINSKIISSLEYDRYLGIGLLNSIFGDSV